REGAARGGVLRGRVAEVGLPGPVERGARATLSARDLMAETERVEPPSLGLAPDPCVARRSRDPSPAPSSLLGLGRDSGAIFRSTHSVSAMRALTCRVDRPSLAILALNPAGLRCDPGARRMRHSASRFRTAAAPDRPFTARQRRLAGAR